MKFFISTPPPHSEAWLISLKRVMCCFCWGQFKEFKKLANLSMSDCWGRFQVPSALMVVARRRMGVMCWRRQISKKFLPSIFVKLIGPNDNSGPTPISAGGINQRSGGGDVGSLGQMETENII